MKLRLNDQVVVISGKDKGKKGAIIKINTTKSTVVVEKINIRTRHMKKTQTTAGEIVKYEAPIHVSNVQIVDPKTGKAARVGYKIISGKKERFSKGSGEPIPTTVYKK